MITPKFKTTTELILSLDEHGLEAFAAGRALSWADSSRLEGLVIDQERLQADILEDYKFLRKTHVKA